MPARRGCLVVVVMLVGDARAWPLSVGGVLYPVVLLVKDLAVVREGGGIVPGKDRLARVEGVDLGVVVAREAKSCYLATSVRRKNCLQYR